MASKSIAAAVGVAAGAGLLHAAATITWACGSRWLLWSLGSRVMDAFGDRLWMLWPVALVKVALAVAPALVVHRRGRLSRPWRNLAALVACALVVWGGANTVIGNLVLTGTIRPAGGYDRGAMIGHAWLWDPLFLLWGIALGVAVIASVRGCDPAGGRWPARP